MQDQNYLKAVSGLCPSLREPLAAVPDLLAQSAQEIRLGAGKPLYLHDGRRPFFLDRRGGCHDSPREARIVTREEVLESFRSLCQYSVHTHLDEMQNGYITTQGGHRAGIAGTAVYQQSGLFTVRDISAICLRIARMIPGSAEELVQQCCRDRVSGILLAGEPGSGKTTLLRDLILQLCSGREGRFVKAVAVDEKNEISSCLEVNGGRSRAVTCELLCGYQKAQGMITAIRNLSPQLVLCDEISAESDLAAVKSCADSGVKICSTIHAASVQEVLRRPKAAALLQSGAFDYLVLLQGSHAPCQIAQVRRVGVNHAEGCGGDAADSVRLGRRTAKGR